MNGKPLPIESKEMQAIVAYLSWISYHYPIYGNAPWLGVKPLKSQHVPDPKNGKKLYKELCMDCHGANGDGGNKSQNHPGKAIPPIFGKNSYNTSAGMNRQDIFASFIYHNMPLGDPHLQVTEALDIAAFVAEQPRPEKKD
jgi:thiosulfate dehydrogenase